MILWRRLDVPGHDNARLLATSTGARLLGVAVFHTEAGPAALSYAVDCDERWRALGGRVEGWIGERAVHHVIAREGLGWTLDGEPARNLDGCLDLDLGITPATNTLALLRMDLKIGDEADAPAAWIDLESETEEDPVRLQRLEQTYRRIDSARYEYTSAYGYEDTLTVDPQTRFVTDYPRLWVREG